MEGGRLGDGEGKRSRKEGKEKVRRVRAEIGQRKRCYEGLKRI